MVVIQAQIYVKVDILFRVIVIVVIGSIDPVVMDGTMAIIGVGDAGLHGEG